MLNPVFWKKVQGQKHPGRWGIVEHKIPSIKVLFKTNTKSQNHPGIKPLSLESKTQLVNQRKQKPGTAHSPKIQSYRMWWDAASPKLNDTPVVCIYIYIYIYIYTSYNRTHIENAYIYVYILTQSFWTGTKVIRKKHIIQLTGFQCWNIVDLNIRDKFQWNVNRSSYIFSQEMHLKMSPAKWRAFGLGLNVLTLMYIHIIHCG